MQKHILFSKNHTTIQKGNFPAAVVASSVLIALDD